MLACYLCLPVDFNVQLIDQSVWNETRCQLKRSKGRNGCDNRFIQVWIISNELVVSTSLAVSTNPVTHGCNSLGAGNSPTLSHLAGCPPIPNDSTGLGKERGSRGASKLVRPNMTISGSFSFMPVANMQGILVMVIWARNKHREKVQSVPTSVYGSQMSCAVAMRSNRLPIGLVARLMTL